MKLTETLTETLAIIISRDMWLWLSENPKVRECYECYDECYDKCDEICNMCKKQYPLYNELDISKFNSECSCCTYYIDMERTTKACVGCPLGNCRIDSYWWEWINGIDRQENAYNIYKQLDEKLKSMEQ